ENQKLNLQYNLTLLFFIAYRFRDLQLLMEKADIVLQNPKVIFLCLFNNSVDNLKKDESETNNNNNINNNNNNNNEDPDNSKPTTDQKK
ncbi:MAG TPA: hypothetical protein VJ697_14365, partial [Nitrososphaeraceae archaeon]|nr:hypothetical protein [Nitrososphaeraceae archaeon]